MSFDHSAVQRRASTRFVFRSLAIGLTTALTVLFLPAPAFAVPGVPDAPAQPTVTHGDGFVSVAFVAPADNGSAIQFYTADCTSSNGGIEGVTSDAASPVEVNGLDNGKTYTCTVSATNGNGTGAASVASASTVPAGVPDAPVKPTVTRGNAQISVAFVAPAAHGSAITGYTAACTSSDGGTAGSLSGALSPLVVTGLTNGSTYTCRVLATNGEGNSTQSLPSTATVPATVPTTPAQPTLVHGNASISVTYTGSAGTGGSIITGYTASCTSSDGGAPGSNSGTSSPIGVATLTNGKTYTCTIHATNAVGNSLESAASASTVPATTPTAPAQPTVTRGDGQISVAFVAPANGGSAITGYTASCTSSDGGVFGTHSGGTSPIVVDALTNFKTYTCTVLATNAEGNSAPSVASASAVPGLVPSAPPQPVVTHGNALISVAFSAPSSNGGSVITGYTASCTSSDGGLAGSNSGATSPIVVSTLTNGKTYTCTVFASNANGAGNASVASAATVPATTPGSPAPATLTHGNASISVAFVAPADGGSAITGYTTSCTSSNGGAPGSNTGAVSPIVVSTLTNGKTYTCVVHATNAEGAGSDSVASATTIPATVPSAPAQPTISALGTTITVTFVAPATGGSAITGYTATCTSSNGGVTGSNTGGASPIGVTALTRGKSYTCTVHATNVEGDSTESPASAAATVPAIAPDAPAQPTATSGNALISVAFSAPGSDGGSAVTGYTATCTSSDGGTAGNNAGASSPIVVSALTNGKTYTCTVHATNVVGSGSESAASNAVVPSTVPSAPAKPTTVAAATHITVTFVAPANGGTAITGYTATCTSSNGGVPGSNTGASSPIAVQSLTKSKSYTCTVHATSSGGDSAESPPSYATVIPTTVPDAPAKPTTTFGNGQISVAVVAPDNGGSAITGYSANCTSSDGGAPGAHSSGTSPIVVTGLDNGKTYTCTVIATNAVGDSNASVASDATVPATVPGTPSAPTLTRGNSSISAAFSAPGSNGGSAITGYTVSCTSSDGGVSGSNSGATSPIVVSSLTNGKTYTCTVLATNVAGNGVASSASTSAVPATVPSTPAAPTLTHGNALISVAFVAPANGGSAITGYTVSCTSSDGGTAGSNSGASSPIVVSSLTNGNTYTCTVLATNAVGSGSASSASTSTVPATVPTAPATPTLTRGNASISVAFVAPANGGSVITGYTASCTSSDGGAAGNNSGATSPIVVSSLTNGKTYTCTVHATNAEGDSAESSASTSVVPATVPTAPAKPTTTPGATSISVAFVAPANGGSAITGYTVSCNSSNGGTAGSNSGATSPIVVSGLSKGKTYTCTVLATNVIGSSSASTASDATLVPTTVPNAPAASTLTHGDASISSAFVAPSDGGSAITGYTATCTSSNGGVSGNNSGAATPIVVSSLTNGKTYTCTVHATNIVGNSTESVASASTMPNVVPNAPARPSVVAVPGQVTVTFVAPSNTGTAITGYTATCTSSNGGVTGHHAGATSPIVVSSLTNGKTYTCTVHATNTEGAGAESVASGAVQVASMPHNTVAPTITGRPIAERLLTGHRNTWTGSPSPAFHYRWQHCNRLVRCQNIPGATAATYRLTRNDVDTRIRFVVSATNVVGTVSRATAVTRVIRTVPAAIAGAFYYQDGLVKRAASGVVGTATHGSTVWTVTGIGNVSGPHFGPMGGTLVGMPLSRPIVGMQVTPTGKGYWLFAGDGGVFTFGDARFYGSTGGMHLNAPVTAMQTTPTGKGYWLFASDGGVFTFGDARFRGSIGGASLAYPAAVMLATQTGNGYWIVTTNGRAFAFGDAASIRSIGSLGRTDIAGLVSTGRGFLYATRSLQLLAP